MRALSIAVMLLTLTLLGRVPAAVAQAVDTVQIQTMSPLERQYMAEQRAEIDRLARRHIGAGFSGNAERDVALLQRLLDEGVVSSEDRQRLQAMGMVLGELLAAQPGMHWVVYTDTRGRSRALRYRDTEHYLFPVTMISRLREAGNNRPVADIYDGAMLYIESVRPPRPYE
jgi:hypothetical protein